MIFLTCEKSLKQKSKDKQNERDNQQRVDEITPYLKTESEEPENY
jgi:hypothetical protein